MSGILKNVKNRARRELYAEADALLRAAGSWRLTKPWVPGERDVIRKARKDRLRRAKRVTQQVMKQQAKHRAEYQQAESKLLKKEPDAA
jgi:hypothetical protein